MSKGRIIYYVGAALDEESSRKLASHIRREGEVPLLEQFHCTVMYSNSWFTYKARDGEIYPLTLNPPFETTMFGSICVLIFIPPPPIIQRHQGLLAAGAKFSYPSYHPHISLCKKILLSPPRFPLTLSSEYYGTWKD